MQSYIDTVETSIIFETLIRLLTVRVPCINTSSQNSAAPYTFRLLLILAVPNTSTPFDRVVRLDTYNFDKTSIEPSPVFLKVTGFVNTVSFDDKVIEVLLEDSIILEPSSI